MPAQSQTGTITGSVRDRLGRGIGHATVEAKSAGTGQKRLSVTSGTGIYNATFLLPGEYRVSVSAEGFAGAAAMVVVSPGANVRQEFTLEAAGATGKRAVGSEGRLVDTRELHELPLLSRDPYRLAEVAGNVSDAGLGTRGVGLAINGQRESSTNILVDGFDNKDEFTGAAGQPFPLDSILEFRVMTSGFNAADGRASGGIVNVAGRSGSTMFHGSGYEFNRVSALTSNSFLDNASGMREAAFSHNQFGESAGGPLWRRKLFFFENTEITVVRSESANYAWVATPQLIAQTAPATQAFFQTLGQLRPGAQTIGSVSLHQLTAASGVNPCTGLACATLPADIPLFSHVAYRVPGDSGGGLPQTTWNAYGRVDYNLSDRTRLYGRYALYDERDQSGTLSSSPYANYDLSQSESGNSVVLSSIHTWNARLVSQTGLSFDRLRTDQQGLTGRGLVPTMYANPIAPLTVGPDPIAFPGYNPFSPGVGGAFGGPENILQVNHDTSWAMGKHLLRLGGDYIYIRDNRTDAAYQTAVDSLSNGGGLGAALAGLQYGTFAQIQVAVNPQGNFPCGQTPSCSIDLPAGPPSFSRSNRFNEGAVYAQDHWRVTRRLAIDAGIRWEHFGVQHNADPNLDSNWYAPGIGFADNDLANYILLGGLQPAAKSPVGGLYAPDWKDFAPRFGIAWDVFGDGRTSVRAGWGIGYDRNFGNVTFNVIQNLPNYAVLDVPGPIATNNFGPLGGSGGSVALPPLGARIIDPRIKTAYAGFYNASIQRQLSRGAVYSLNYSGSKGVHLYSVSYPNQDGFGNVYAGYYCTGNGDCRTPPNAYYGEDVGYRGNQGASSYYGIENRISVRNLLNRGIALTATYTWSHAVDNLSSTLFEAGGQGVANRFGDGNITVNNGDFDLGLLDPYQPNLDRGAAEFDVRHRVTLVGNWTIPAWNRTRRTKLLTGGWSVDPLFLARSGQPFSVFDTIAQTLDLNAPRAAFNGTYPTSRNTFVAGTTPDTFHLITFLPAQIAHEPNLLTPGSRWPSNMSPRDAFRAPGFWNLDIAVVKDTTLNEKLALQLRAEFFNAFNHANLYVIGTSANTGASNTVDACFGCSDSTYDRRQIQLAARLSF